MTTTAKSSVSVLVVEDEAAIRTILCDTLEHHGFVVYRANDGIRGLALAAKERPDIILLDIMMPRMDGKKMLNLLRVGNEWSSRVPVILLSNLDTDDQHAFSICTTDGFTYCMLKSDMKVADVIEKITSILLKIHDEPKSTFPPTTV